ncbi:MFS transporter [Crossiella cryophila]|uniref:Putative MFS family arabinose efflux permease n=1 Tax=Crossiella cryophila TaxID=43355 RepID=A0A7W7FTU2_9PSEU|nr:MFS transporter [Crossiella cryophila]MBB4677360.1 putative MFS family arabinose efflux permease [Crossiella cryophila]
MFDVSRQGGFVAAFGIAEFRALWLAELQSVIGDQLAKVALSLLVFERTRSPLLTAGAYALTMLPQLVAGPLLSWLADRYPRRTVMTHTSLAQALLVGLMAVPGMPLWLVAALLVLVQLVQAPFAAAQAATVPVVLTGEVYQAGQALRQITANAAMLLGLAGGGLAVGLLGPHVALAIDAVTFALVALLVRLGVKHRPAAREAPATAARRSSGVLLVWRNRRLRALLGLSWLAGIAVVPEGLAAPLAAEYGAGPAAVGWLLAVDPAAYALSTFLLTRWTSTETRLRLLGVFAVGSVAMLLGFAGVGLTGALILLAVSGALAAYQVTAAAEFMAAVPDADRGAAYGVARTGLRVVQGLGVVAGGVGTELIGSPSTTVTLAGAVGLVLAVPAAWAWRRARQEGPVSPSWV